MPDDVGGRPFPDGWEPDDDRGGADEDFASVVFDEDFVRAAAFHEPTAVERLLAAAEARAEAEAARSGSRTVGAEDELYDDEYGSRAYARGGTRDDDDDADPDDDFTGPYGRHGGALRPYRGTARWHRPVAWVLALVMGIGMVALAFTAVYRGASGNRQDPTVPAPTTTGVDATPTGATVTGSGHGPEVSDARSAPPVPAEQHTP
ncbi:hypothetical protein [Streptomyces sp. NPDC058572]|uniref:SCO2584 family spore wall biosynthesis protein n=1 Tax=Streptomyces sp. NPDC058572 TaxID=3346546 RepID=UPI00364CBCB4